MFVRKTFNLYLKLQLFHTFHLLSRQKPRTWLSLQNYIKSFLLIIWRYFHFVVISFILFKKTIVLKICIQSKISFKMNIILNKSLLTALIVLTFLWMVCSSAQEFTPTTTPNTSTVRPGDECKKLNSCEDCVRNSACYYCYPTKTCDEYPYKSLKPYDKCGGLKDMAWKTCLVDFKVLIIVLSSVGGGLLLISIICCCCLCKKVRRAQLRRQIEKWERKRTDQKAMQEERRVEREQKRQQIRDKYGLSPNNNPYSRFD